MRDMTWRRPSWLLRPCAIAAATIAGLVSPAGADAPADSLPAFPTAAVRAVQLAPGGADRVAHASLAGTIALAAGVSTRSATTALGSGLLAGLVKEWLDARRGGRFDPGDLAADALGAGGAALLTRELER
jgi:hypothetical protein